MEVFPMTITQIDVDDDALRDVMRGAGLTTKKEAVNAALRDYAAKLRRSAEFDRYIERSQGWDYDAWVSLRAADKAGAA